ncbi:MAG: cation transporter [Azospirillaceae bacterium]|nr:cation transporter [Azospirillaceae bacterium]
MPGCCHDPACAATTADQPSAGWRRALWVALVINAALFVGEVVAGLAAGSAALQADALDFLGDAANYAISLAVAGMAVRWRTHAALAKGLSLSALALWVAGGTAWHAWAGTLPRAPVMGGVALAAMAANGIVALLLYRFRDGDANMRSVWICTRNDVIGNAAVLLAAAGVFGTGTAWPDILVAAVMAALGLSGGITIIRHARSEMRLSARPAWTATPAAGAPNP